MEGGEVRAESITCRDEGRSVYAWVLVEREEDVTYGIGALLVLPCYAAREFTSQQCGYWGGGLDCEVKRSITICIPANTNIFMTGFDKESLQREATLVIDRGVMET